MSGQDLFTQGGPSAVLLGPSGREAATGCARCAPAASAVVGFPLPLPRPWRRGITGRAGRLGVCLGAPRRPRRHLTLRAASGAAPTCHAHSRTPSHVCHGAQADLLVTSFLGGGGEFHAAIRPGPAGVPVWRKSIAPKPLADCSSPSMPGVARSDRWTCASAAKMPPRPAAAGRAGATSPRAVRARAVSPGAMHA